MKLDFFKMHAQGNDYIYFDFLNKEIPDIDFSELSKKLSNRHFAIGADGIVLISNDKDCDAYMRIFNIDGSEAEMCGSALRCTGYYLNKHNWLQTDSVNTKSGIKRINIPEDDIIEVSLGNATMITEKPVNITGFNGNLVDIGNPHFVCFTDVLNPQITSRFGPLIENDEYFPNKINIEFVQILSRDEISIEIWERGSGRTLACGTGAGASAFACCMKGLTQRKVKVNMPGGSVFAEIKDSEILLSGEVSFVFEGTILL